MRLLEILFHFLGEGYYTDIGACAHFQSRIIAGYRSFKQYIFFYGRFALVDYE
jgi:hypothetical protein